MIMMMLLEIFCGMVFFGFLGILSLILIPSIFGCLGFILFWVFLLGLLVFFSINIGWFILFVIAGYALLALSKYIRYSNLVDYDQYISENPGAYQDGKVCCKNCGSPQIIHQGLYGTQSKLRYYWCMNCRQWLYKFKVI